MSNRLDATRTPPTGSARVAWSFLGTVVIALVAGLFAVVGGPIGDGVCGPDALVCSVGVGVVATLLGALIGAAGVAATFGLGWEWFAVVAAVVVAAPMLLDLLDVGGWLLLALAPVLAGLATWTGPDRPRWRPVAIGGGASLLVLLALVVTFGTPA